MATNVMDFLKKWRAAAIDQGILDHRTLPEDKIGFVAKGIMNGEVDDAITRLALDKERGLDLFALAYRALRDTSSGGLGYGGRVLPLPADARLAALAEALPAQEPVATGGPYTRTEATAQEATGVGPATAELPAEDPKPGAVPVETLSGVWAPYEGAPPARLANLRVDSAGESAVRVSWTASGANPFQAFRVVYRDDYRPYSPDSGTQLVVTTETSVVLPESKHHGIRYVTVWEYSGESEQTARASTPRLLGDIEVVTRPRRVGLTAENKQVLCTWSLPPMALESGTILRVDVTRIDEYAVQAGGLDGFGGIDIQPSSQKSGGFTDHAVTPAASYVYRLVVRARTSDGLEVAALGHDETAHIPAPLTAVTDLRVEPAASGIDGFVDLHWTSPLSGEVWIMRTATEVVGRSEPVRANALGQVGYTDDPLRNPVDFNGKQRVMRDVSRPDGWVMAFFTPVTVQDERALIGTTVNGEPAPGAPTRFTIIERVTEQILRFGWPAGATEVEVRLGPPGADRYAILRQPPHKLISEAEYLRQGGYHLGLPWMGARILITSGRSWGGKQFRGETVEATYPGILVLRYAVRRTKSLFGSPSVRVSVWTPSGRDRQGAPLVNGSPHLTLVHHQDRLPLSLQDEGITPVMLNLADTSGERVPRFRPSSLYHPPGTEEWVAELNDRRLRRGYLRLFISEPSAQARRFALIDPPVSSLKG